MRTFILTLVLMLGVTAMAQENKETLKTVTVKEGKLTKVNIYHENGQLAQQGYLKNNKLHGKWVKYSENGNLLCVAKYNRGKRNGTWLFWDNKDLTEVEFKNNKVLQKLTFEAQSKVVSIDR